MKNILMILTSHETLKIQTIKPHCGLENLLTFNTNLEITILN